MDGNYSQIVDKEDNEAKRAELTYELLNTVETEEGILNHVRIHLLTGRPHQIRVQFSGHGTPLYGDNRYNPAFGGAVSLALCAVSLAFDHPTIKKRMEFSIQPSGGAFQKFK